MRLILYEKQGEKFMKIELQISETYKEEKLIVQAPQETDKIQKVIEFAENLDQKKQSKERLMIRSISLRLVRYSASISRIGRFLQKRLARPTILILRLYQVLEILPTNFIQISQSEIININSISHLKLTPNGLVKFS